MRQRSTNALGPILLAVLVLLAAGCGGGGKKTAATAPASTAQATTEAAATSSSSTTSALAGIATAANCKQLADLSTRFTEAAGGTAAGDTKKVAQLLEEFAAKTPADIRPDFQVLSDAFSKLADAVGTMKPGTVPDASTLAKLQKLSGEIDSERLAKASANIAVWVQKNCHA